ncbi:hypothetical protein KIN20_010054 [Parelaphostrongylus tenuis]|uniref:Uncharacterized protein n=1 Tax=Parelaphostrongylus tenuis TaxID=148309 RepID=A0AAD5QK22_PARTN|nr:hypothetical protein KIN20_010054 [Parelaphostrongylus tenuis]
MFHMYKCSISGMTIFTNMVAHLTNFFVVTLLAIIFTVLGCEVMPAGQMSTRTFTVTGSTTLPVAIVYIDATAVLLKLLASQVTEEELGAFVSRLVMQTPLEMANFRAKSNDSFLSSPPVHTLLAVRNMFLISDFFMCEG